VRLEIGSPAPAFTLQSDTGAEVSLADFSGRTALVYFYPAAMTPGCTKQACDFRDNLGAFESSGHVVIGISPDKQAKLARFRENDELPFTLLSDPDHAVMERYGAWGEKQLYGKTVTGVIRSTIVVGPTGLVEVAQYNVKATGHVAKLMRDLRLA
jgi:peroxiredoxin Q/BCP